MRVLLTRPRADSQRIADQLAALGHETLIWPLIETRTIGDSIEIASGVEALVFTSSNAIRALVDLSEDRSLPAYCVGARTALLASNAGFDFVDICGGTAEDLAGKIRRAGFRHILHPRGVHVSAEFAALLADADVRVDEVVVYESVAMPAPDSALKAALLSQRVDIATVWSPRTGQLLVDALRELPEFDVSRTTLVAISENAAKPLSEVGFRAIVVAAHPSGSGMLKAIEAQERSLRQ